VVRTPVASAATIEPHDDPRTTSELLRDIEAGDRSAEAPLYVRAVSDLDRMAAIAVGSSAMDRDDLHQEGAYRLIVDARSGKIRESFGGQLGPYVGRAVLGHLRNIASTQAPGRPTDPTRLTQKMRQALRATADEFGEYDLVAAAVYARGHFQWDLSTFWEVYRVMFAGTEDLYEVAETHSSDEAATDLDRVETVETVRAIMTSGILAPREREVIATVFGLDGPALEESDAATVLGISRQAVNRTKNSALAKLAIAVDL